MEEARREELVEIEMKKKSEKKEEKREAEPAGHEGGEGEGECHSPAILRVAVRERRAGGMSKVERDG